MANSRLTPVFWTCPRCRGRTEGWAMTLDELIHAHAADCPAGPGRPAEN